MYVPILSYIFIYLINMNIKFTVAAVSDFLNLMLNNNFIYKKKYIDNNEIQYKL